LPELKIDFKKLGREERAKFSKKTTRGVILDSCPEENEQKKNKTKNKTKQHLRFY
jgi:hypothetical protein